MNRRANNTVDKGSVRYIVFKEDDTWYAVGLEFNIVEEGEDPNLAMYNLFEAMNGYVNTARKVKARPFALNQVPDEEYEQMWNGLIKRKKNAALKNKEIVNFGERLVAA